MPFFIPASGGSSSPTGLPLPVEDEAERLALTPTADVRIKQLDTGEFWVYVVGFGDYVPCPPLEQDPALNQVVAGVQVQTRSHPTGASGTLVLGLPVHVADDTALDAETAGTGKVIVKDDDGELFIMDDPSRSGLVRLNSPAFPSEIFFSQLMANVGGSGTDGSFSTIGLDRINVDEMVAFMYGKSVAWNFSSNGFTTANLDAFFAALLANVSSFPASWAGSGWDFTGNEEPTPTVLVAGISGLFLFSDANTWVNSVDTNYVLSKSTEWSLLYGGSLIEQGSGETQYPWDSSWPTYLVSKEVNKDVYALRNSYGLTVDVTT